MLSIPGRGNSKINVLLVGGGAREHALALKISASARLGDFYATDADNPGIASLCKPVDVPVNIREIYRLRQFCDKKDIGLVVIGPEDPLAEGYTDKLASANTLVFGPTKEAAQLESDKAFAKQIMRAASVPTGEARVFTDAESALAYVQSRVHPPVIKAAGLAKGKGVVVPSTIEEAAEAIDRMMVKLEFGDAGRKVVVEERLEGPEVSVLAIVDGKNILMLPPCQDHKRLSDGDQGPNTGGMGAFCPAGTITPAIMDQIERQIMVPTIDAMRREGIEFRGVLYAGLMLTFNGPKVLEFNTRFGDPECQPLMARLKSDLLELLLGACLGKLDEVTVEWDPGAACCVVLASKGYPAKPVTGMPIHGVEEAEKTPGVQVIFGGAKRVNGQLVTSGGRVLSVVATGESLAAARTRAYEACEHIVFSGKTWRTDIGAAVEATGSGTGTDVPT